MSLHERIVPMASGYEAFISELTAEVWLDPNAAEEFSTDREAFVHRFAAERGYATPTDIQLRDLKLQASPVGEMDIAVPIHAQATTAENFCNTNPAYGCGPTISFFCVSRNPGSCPSMNFDCPSQKCTAYPCGVQ